MEAEGRKLARIIEARGWPSHRPPLLDEVRALSASMAPVRERGYLKFDEFLRLAKLKSSQGMHHVALNESHIVEAVTRIAFSSQLEDERVRIGLLTSVRGVDIPRASALLCWTHPDRWPVIDRRAWTTLNHLGFVRTGARLERGSAKQMMRAYSPKEWVDYVSLVKIASNAMGWSAMEIDQWLYACDLKDNLDHLN